MTNQKDQNMSILFQNARIVDIVKVTDDSNLIWFDLHLETDCSFHLGSVVTVPNDQEIFALIDIPAYDGRNVAQWIRDVAIL